MYLYKMNSYNCVCNAGARGCVGVRARDAKVYACARGCALGCAGACGRVHVCVCGWAGRCGRLSVCPGVRASGRVIYVVRWVGWLGRLGVPVGGGDRGCGSRGVNCAPGNGGCGAWQCGTEREPKASAKEGFVLG